MTSKRILKMNMPEVNLYIVVVGIASIFLLYYNFYIGILFFIGFLYMVFNNWKTTNIRRKEWNNYIELYKKDKNNFKYCEEHEIKKDNEMTLKEKAKALFEDI